MNVIFEQDGRTYHHIIDPKTGYPVENGLISVSIVTADGTLADGLSTSVFIMGKEAATEYWRNHSDEFDMILMTDDRKSMSQRESQTVLSRKWIRRSLKKSINE